MAGSLAHSPLHQPELHSVRKDARPSRDKRKARGGLLPRAGLPGPTAEAVVTEVPKDQNAQKGRRTPGGDAGTKHTTPRTVRTALHDASCSCFGDAQRCRDRAFFYKSLSSRSECAPQLRLGAGLPHAPRLPLPRLPLPPLFARGMAGPPPCPSPQGWLSVLDLTSAKDGSSWLCSRWGGGGFGGGHRQQCRKGLSAPSPRGRVSPPPTGWEITLMAFES